MNQLFQYQNHFPTIGNKVFVADNCSIIGQVTLGDDSSVFYGCVLRGDINSISIGAKSNVQDGSVFHVSTPLGVELGEQVSVGHNCIVHACKINDRILVGMGSIVMDGVEVGSDCIIAAGSLLPKGKKYPSGSLILGSPAKVIRPLTQEEMNSIPALAEKYIGVKNNYLAN